MHGHGRNRPPVGSTLGAGRIWRAKSAAIGPNARRSAIICMLLVSGFPNASPDPALTNQDQPAKRGKIISVGPRFFAQLRKPRRVDLRHPPPHSPKRCLRPFFSQTWKIPVTHTSSGSHDGAKAVLKYPCSWRCPFGLRRCRHSESFKFLGCGNY